MAVRLFWTARRLFPMIIGMVLVPFSSFECGADDATGPMKAEGQLPPGVILNIGAPLADKRDPDDDVMGPSFEFPLAFSPDGTVLATGDYPARSWDRSIVLWDVKSGNVIASSTAKELNREPDLAAAFVSVAFSPDGQRLVAAKRSRLILWKVGVRDEMRILKVATPSIFRVAFSPAGDLFAVGKSHSLELRSAETGTPLLEFKPYRNITDFSTMTFSPDGKTIATSDDRGAVLIWDIAQLRTHYQK